jgi:hypothetical protein
MAGESLHYTVEVGGDFVALDNSRVAAGVEVHAFSVPAQPEG